MARRARTLAELHQQINGQYPQRDTASDGWIADANHSSSSDHVPRDGIVHAIDVDEDDKVGDQRVGRELWSWLLDMRPPWVKYAIYEGQIVSSYAHVRRGRPWTPGPYTGSNPHDKHVHISVYDDREHNGPDFVRSGIVAEDNWIDENGYPTWVRESATARAMVKAVFTKHTDPHAPFGSLGVLNAMVLVVRAVKYATKG